MRHRAMRGQRAAVPDPHLPPPAPATRQRPVALGCGSLQSGLSFCPHDSLPPQIHFIFGSYCVICVWSARPVRRVGERGSPRQGSSRQAGSGSSTHQLACGFFWAAFEQTAEFQTGADGCHHARQVSNPFRIVPPPQPLPWRLPCPAPQLCDQVSDAILDACLEQDPESKVACETATKTNMVGAAGRGRARMPRFQIRCPSRFLAHAGRRGGAPWPLRPATGSLGIEYTVGCLSLCKALAGVHLRCTDLAAHPLVWPPFPPARQVMVFGEITTRAKVDYEAVVRKTCKEIGFISDDVGLDADKCKVGGRDLPARRPPACTARRRLHALSAQFTGPHP